MRIGIRVSSLFLIVCLSMDTLSAQRMFATVPVGGIDTELWKVDASPFNAVLVDSFGAIKAGSGLDFSPINGLLYASTGFGDGGKLYTIDTTTAAALLIGPTGFIAVPGLAIAPNGSMFGSAVYGPSNLADVLIRIDPTTGTGTRIGVFGALGPDSIFGLDGIAFDPTTGTLYGAAGFAIAQRPGHFFSIDTTTGLATHLGTLTEVVTGDTLPTTPAGVTFDEAGNCFVSLGNNDGRIVRVYVDSLKYEYIDTVKAFHSISDIAIPRAGSVTHILQKGTSLPSGFSLSQNYPNPFNPTTAIRYQISAPARVELHVFDQLGREVAELVNKQQDPGSYQIIFNGGDLPSGVYYYRIIVGAFIQTKSLLLVK